MENKLRILVVSNTPWDDSNSFGNSFSNIFGSEIYQIANIYCQAGKPYTKSASRFFQITEKSIIRKLLHKQKIVGVEVFQDFYAKEGQDGIVSFKTMSKFKQYRWQILFWLRDVIWGTKVWKSMELNDFILDFKPDLIFLPIYYSSYIGEIGLYAQSITKVPIIGYQSDDNVTYKQFSFSPLFWIDRFIKVPKVRKVVRSCELLYVITEKQRDEYDKLFGKGKCKVLYKGGDFSCASEYIPNDIIQLTYTGNIGMGRWMVLAKIASALENINLNGLVAQLHIYSATPLSQKMDAALNKGKSSIFEGRVPIEQVVRIQKSSDILVHVESFQLSERYKSRLSFSTKLVDYFESHRCIFAVGWEQSGGIEYLKSYNAAVCVTHERDIETSLKDLVTSKTLIKTYADRGFECGKNNHQIKEIQSMLYSDILRIVNNNKIA